MVSRGYLQFNPGPAPEACRLSLQGLSMAKNQLGAARFGTSLQALLPQAVSRCGGNVLARAPDERVFLLASGL